MARRPKPWYRTSRKSWFVTVRGIQHCLGPNKREAFERFYELMKQPVERKVSADLEFSAKAERIALVWRDPKVFDEVMAENKRLNAEELARQNVDPLPIKKLRISAAMNHFVNEFRTIIRVEELDPREAMAYLTATLREEVELSTDGGDSLNPESHDPKGASEEQKRLWRQQENDPRLVAAAKEAEENIEHVEMPSRHSLPRMSSADKKRFVEEVEKATQSLGVEITPAPDPKVSL